MTDDVVLDSWVHKDRKSKSEKRVKETKRFVGALLESGYVLVPLIPGKEPDDLNIVADAIGYSRKKNQEEPSETDSDETVGV